MKNKKGFTLVELLAVIVIIALPNVIGMFKSAKKSSFITELKEVYKSAESQWINDSMFNTGYWTETWADSFNSMRNPYTGIFFISGDRRTFSSAGFDYSLGVRPAIEVSVNNINY